MSQWCARRSNTATPWTNKNDSCWNKRRSCQDDSFCYITRSYEWSCWELEQNKNKFPFWPPGPCIFRIACRYLLHSLIFPHSLRIFEDFGTQIMNTAVFVKIFIFQKQVLFPIWTSQITIMPQGLAIAQQKSAIKPQGSAKSLWKWSHAKLRPE